MYPAADIPVVQVGLQFDLGPLHRLRLGRALVALRAHDVLVIGSGSFTHNLSRLRREAVSGVQLLDVAAFSDWFDTAITERRVDDLLDYRAKGPFAVQQHPTDEHLLPLFVVLGAAGENARPERLHSSAMYSSLRMDAYAFG
jgi:4,5-DOPA dioxygenase extradiol